MTDSNPTDDQPDDATTAVTDGGEASSPFEVVSQTKESRQDRLWKLFDSYVRAPVAIVWRDWRARIGFTIVLIYLVMGIVGPHVIEPTAVTDGPALVQPFESLEFPLGTDSMGRDLFAQTVYSTTTILKMITAGALFTITLGTTVGAIAGYKGGMTDTVLSSITDVFINIPGFPLVMVLALLLPIGGNPFVVGILLCTASWGGLARSIRSQVLTLRQESFVEASQAMGLSTNRIVFKEIVPHLMPFVVINLTNAARRVIFEAAALYYLGILPFSNLNWGVVLNLAYTSGAYYQPGALHWFLVPMGAIVFLSIGLILLGQSLDRVFNPRVRARHEKRTDAGDDLSSDHGGV
ncbi:ABC transporter permease (plasmid) [Halarchaeum sp. CBA1220]|uniref:ABC transporter permease n=1 Tax=Halarchaeum sp. CBA1220 TaxID=1853682 RepID=UPI000F3A8032|nr:ABC transporter permease [Halarchaeum sp. CBA1220]QLC34730.1 ABC transporter permease [Halarchaeum sp. CBA1220]